MRRIITVLGIAVLVVVLALAVWRVLQPKSIISLPKASSGAKIVPIRRPTMLPPQSKGPSFLAEANSSVLAATSIPATGHYISDIFVDELFVTNGGSSINNYTVGLEKSDGSCQFTVTNPNTVTITNNQFNFNYQGLIISGTFNPSSNTVDITASLNNLSVGGCGDGGSGDLGTDIMSLTTCSQAGQALCSGTCVSVTTDNNNCGSCGSVCPSGKSCSGGFCVTGTTSGGSGQCVVPSQSHLACGSNGSCVRKLGAGNNLDGCTSVGGTCNTGQVKKYKCSGSSCVEDDANGTFTSTNCNNTCTSTTSEVNSCWGNGGTNGKCYDCNGDGEINMLDFSGCFLKNFNKNVQ